MNIKTTNFFANNDKINSNYDMKSAFMKLHNLTNPTDMTGWLNLKISDEELSKIKALANKIKNSCNILIVIGAGGSYCGARAVIEALNSQFYNDLAVTSPKIYFIGNNLSGTYLQNIIKICDGGDVCVNVISKSGTTLEPSAAFRVMKNYLEKRYGKEQARERIVCTTDANKGVLRELCNKNNYETLVVPSDIGGRFSVLSAVGLLPIAVSGINIDELLKGSYDAEKEYANENFEENSCCQYALARKYLSDCGKKVEMTAVFEPSAEIFLEWHRQLFAESLGKEHIGVLPCVCVFTRDLHSIGQFIQDGSPILFETIIKFEDDGSHCAIPDIDNNSDGLSYITDEELSSINNKAIDGVIAAHCEGNVPIILITIPKLNPYNIGNLIYFMEKACALNGILDNINPFDQPGVEAYKKNVKKILINSKQ